MTFPPTCDTCPIRAVSRGFALDAGDPRRARIGFLFETPASTEIGWRVGAEELAVRRRDYPSSLIPAAINLTVGEPVVGPMGALWESWLLRPVGLKREDVYMGNVLHCFPPKNKKGEHYPVGKDRKAAEKCCTAYNARWDLFWEGAKKRAEIISMHPREVTPLPLITQMQRVPGLYSDLRKAVDMAADGWKVRVLMGAKAAESVLGYGGNTAKWRGSYFIHKGFSG